ncbi:hypothetical protein PIB30_006428 [Stylosanthes scabra]|uniref:Uncharacterized protein n=1 Tax=Stylosanthes scabra TaxID=79078 RepID=A0ABU6U377_9FABA|nr:hypothetical protein [Stylosanthes scabra]
MGICDSNRDDNGALPFLLNIHFVTGADAAITLHRRFFEFVLAFLPANFFSIFPQISREESLIAVTKTKERNPNPHPHVRRRFGQNNHLLNQKIAKKKESHAAAEPTLERKAASSILAAAKPLAAIADPPVALASLTGKGEEENSK